MKHNQLADSDLRVPEICLGTMTWGEQNSESDAHEQLSYALAHGVNFIDTAEMYPVPPRAATANRTESYIGTWVKRQTRDKFILATKVAGPGRRDWLRAGRTELKREHIFEALEGSLQRLQTDYIDLYQIHWPDRNVQIFGQTEFDPEKERPHVPILEQMQAMAELIQQGKIRHYGVSNETSWGLCQYATLARLHGLPMPVSTQNVYNIVSRQFDLDLAETSFRENIPLLAFSPLGGGALSGKYLNGAKPAGARFTLFPDFHLRFQRPAVGAAVADYAALAKARGLSLDQMALAFIRQRWFVRSTVIGATTVEQLKRNIDSANITLDADTLKAIADIHARHSNPAP